jgi:P4 family phage/plasmid primase-like protien
VSFVNPRTLIRDLAGAIISKERFARNGSSVLYAYRDGVYRPDGEMLIRRRVKHLLLDNDCTEMWSRRLAGEIVEFITLDVPELPERPSTELINVENGFLNVRTRQLFPHSPDLLSTIRIPVTYDPQAGCPEIDRFIGEIFPEDAIPLAWEILGDLLTPDRSVQKAICLLGEGGNGKSVFLDLAARFVGQENVCHLSLQRLETDRFSAARLYGKLANICTDLPGERLTSSAMFKAITGCDRITAEVKYRDSFEFIPFARLLFSANRLPASNDASQAFFDRWLIVPFASRFRQTRREIPRRILEWRLCSPMELSGALNKALDGLERVRKCFRYTESRDSRVELKRYQAANDLLAAWLDEYTVEAPDAVVPQRDLHRAYSSHCQQSSRRPASKQMFGRRLRALRPAIESGQRTVAGRRAWVYAGIDLRDKTANEGPKHGPRMQ